MSSFSDIARRHTSIDGAGRAHLRRLTGSWATLADLAFSDLLLVVPSHLAEDQGQGTVLGQIRPTTAQTLFVDDLVGVRWSADREPLVNQALESGEIVSAKRSLPGNEVPVVVDCVPVRHEDRILAVLLRYRRSRFEDSSRLESAYQNVVERMATMVADGTFPFPFEGAIAEEAPRVGDGALVLDGDGLVQFSSPNSVSAMHRLGYHGQTVGRPLSDLGFDADAVSSAYQLKVPVLEEVQRGELVTIVGRILPLIADDKVTGALVLVRDVSDVRRRDRMLVSMDATIREIHHRVKNNLQTVSSLLRIQGRRLESPEAKAAIGESVRRIAAIAVVHEMLATGGGDEVLFRDVVEPVIATAQSALTRPDTPIRFRLVGEGAALPASRASSLAVVVNELVQNAIEHGYPPGHPGGLVTVELVSTADQLMVRVHDDGVGVQSDFDVELQAGLGLTIINTLVTGELQGQLRVTPVAPPRSGTLAQVTIRLSVDAD